MNKYAPDKPRPIRPEMTVLDVISKYRQTESIFREYDKQAGECICCQALFDPLQDIAKRYGLDLGKLMADLEAAALSTAQWIDGGASPGCPQIFTMDSSKAHVAMENVLDK